MSCLTIYADDTPGLAVLRTEDAAEIAGHLAGIGVRFERWDSPVRLAADATEEAVLAAFRPWLDRLIGPGGAGSADVIRLTPDHPDAEALRRKFRDEHTHTEDEIRFFVRGSGNFILHVNDRIYDAHCRAGDLIGVPTGIRHWFDAGPAPDFTALRIFTERAGWVPHFTGHQLADAFPAAW